jgi:arylsulfatase A-like enzyme
MTHKNDPPGWKLRTLVVLALLAATAASLAADSVTNILRKAAPRRPSIIFILADDLGYGDLGCYGQTKIKTPNIDKLAAEGIRFTSFYAGSTVCAPSRCALMTGLHTGHAFVRGNAVLPLRPEDTTVAELLKQDGYHTALIGKWGLGNELTSGVPQKKGFDEFAGYLDQTQAHDYYPAYLWRYDPQLGFDDREMILANQNGFKRVYSHDLFTRAATNFIQIHRPEAANHFRPFFLYLAYTIPHANNEETRRSGNGMEVPDNAPYSNEPWPAPEKNKAAMITRMDRDVGLIMDELKDLKIDDNTVVFFSSDNGPHKEGGNDPKFFESAGPLRGIKRDLYEGGIRVPMIVRWPRKIPAGRVSDLPLAFWDFLPTAIEIAGEEPPKNLDGISFLPTLLGTTQTNQHAFLYWEFHERGFQQAVRMGDWKAVRPQAGELLELYDLKTDIGEKTNVAPQHADVVTKIEEYLKTARTESPNFPIKPAPKKQAGKS